MHTRFTRPLGGWDSEGALKKRFRPPFHKVFVHLFQKVAGIQRAAPFGRWPQPAERSILQAYLGVWGPLQEKGPRGPSFLRPARRETASPMGRWPRQGPEGALPFFLLPAAALQNRFEAPASAISRLPPGGVVGSRPDRRVTFLRGQESNQRNRRGPLPAPWTPGAVVPDLQPLYAFK